MYGPGLYTALMDSLLRRMKLQLGAFANNFKFVADVVANSQTVIQTDINSVVYWSTARCMLLTLDKWIVLHCGSNQPFNGYTISDHPKASVNLFKDLGVICSVDGYYIEYCNTV